jgi:hypothetical protein
MSLKRSLRSPLRPAALSPLQHALIAGGVTAPARTYPASFNILLSSPVGATIADGTGVVTINNNPIVDVTPVLTVSQTTGVAPFGLVFDGVQTTCTDAGVDTYHDLIYYFEFGDTSCTNYTNGMLAGKTRNKFLGGPVTAFTFETPDTYSVRMWVSDGVRVFGPAIQSITVDDPDIVFAGAATTVVSSSGDFTGAPAGATQVTSSDFDAQILSGTVSGSNKRVLFRRGETFNSGTAGTFNTRSNYYVGVFGAGTDYATVNAVANGISPMLGGAVATVAQNNNDITYTGLHFTRPLGGGITGGGGVSTSGEPQTTGGIDYTQGATTIHKCKGSNISAFASCSGSRNVVISSCFAENMNEGIGVSGGIGVWMNEIVRGAVVDCNFDTNNGGEHVIRRQGGNYCTFISNKLQRPAVNKSFLTIRGWQYRTAGTAVTAQYNQASYNDIDGSTNGAVASYLPIDVSPQNSNAVEPIDRVIVENNYVRVHNAGQFAMAIQASNVNVRGNVFHFPSTVPQAVHGISLGGATTGAAAATNCRLLNNTLYHEGTFGFTAFRQAATTPGTNQFYGNLAYAPNSTREGDNSGAAPTFMNDLASSAVLLGGNSSNAQVKSTDPLFVGPTTSHAGFAIQSGSPYKNFAADYKVRVDAAGKLKIGATFDAGAFNAPDKQVDAWTIALSASGMVLYDREVYSASGTVTVPVTLPTAAGVGGVTVNYATQDDTATAPAYYTGTSGTLTFAEGETTKNVTVSITA